MKNLFKKYYHSVLNPGEFSEVSDFMGNKKNDSVIFNLMKPLWNEQMSEQDSEPVSNPILLSRIKESIWLEKQKAAQRKITVYAWGLRIAAVLVVALVISNIFFLGKPEQNNLVAQLQTITTPMGAKSKIVLSDSSVVWLNSGSTLSYPQQFGENRPVTLIGEAYFEVMKNEKPFVVSTNYGDVKVKGTSFNVKAYSDDNAFEATLEEGVVAFKVKNTENEVTLQPGEQIEKTAKGFNVKQVETKYFTSWREGKLLFYREPFPSFIKKLERWYNVKIDYADPELDKLWYTGTIEMETISEVMEMISKAAPVNYSFNNKTRVFTIKAKRINQ
jgi:ferric-dicitrate binding protein FerR (iron transport regulator)